MRFNSHHEWSVLQSSIYSPLLLTLLHCVFSLSSENLILLVKGPSSPLNSLLDIENVDLNMIISMELVFVNAVGLLNLDINAVINTKYSRFHTSRI